VFENRVSRKVFGRTRNEATGDEENLHNDESEFVIITNLTHLFMYLFISSLYMFRASQCSSSGGRIALIHLV